MINLETKKLVIEGGYRLEGEVKISGAKNSALPLITASLIVDSDVVLKNIPAILDVYKMCELLEYIGSKVTFKVNVLHLTPILKKPELLTPLTQSVRYSINLLGPLLLKFGYAKMSLPGGCKIGTRKIVSHILGLERLGAKIIINIEDEIIEAEAKQLRGNVMTLEFPSVSATEHIMVTASLAKGTTIIQNVAKEPEIIDLANFLNSMGARIKGAGTNTVKIEGVNELNGVEYSIMPDRIETGTFMLVAAVTKGDVLIEETCPNYLSAFIEKLRAMGVEIRVKGGSVHVKMSKRPRAIEITTGVYPGFPTDFQPQTSAVLCLAEGRSFVRDSIFSERFSHIGGLKKMGAKIEVINNTAVIDGVEKLISSEVEALDIRAGAALLLAALSAEGETIIHNAYQIYRGYEEIDKKLKKSEPT